MASIAQISRNEQGEIEGTLKKFFTDYKISSLLKACRAEKQKGHSAFEIFRYLLCLVFCDRSMYMQIMTGRYTEAFGKNTVYRFLNSVKTNWERITCMLSARIINGSVQSLPPMTVRMCSFSMTLCSNEPEAGKRSCVPAYSIM